LLFSFAAVPVIQAQDDPKSWLYGIWRIMVSLPYPGRQQPKHLEDIQLRMNEDGYTLNVKGSCSVEWALESVGNGTIIFRERVAVAKTLPKYLAKNAKCLDGGAIVLNEARKQPSGAYRFSYYPPGAPIDEESWSVEGFFSPQGVRKDSPDYLQYFAMKVGKYSVDRSNVETVREFGLRIGIIPYSSDFYPIVVAVQEGSPAYFGGIAPGDILISLGERWSASGGGSFKKTVDMYGHRLDASLLGVYYDVADSQSVKSKYVNLAYWDKPNPGKWITTVPVHTQAARTLLPGVREANAAAQVDYDNTSRRYLNEMKAAPCGTDESRIMTMERSLNELAVKGGDFGENANRRPMLKAAAAAICEIKRDGGLTRTEMAVLAVALKKLDPCEYNPQTDLEVLFDELEEIRHLSKKGYLNAFNRELSGLYLTDIMGLRPPQRSCLTKILKAALNIP
jgi:hypothetical protein